MPAIFIVATQQRSIVRFSFVRIEMGKEATVRVNHRGGWMDNFAMATKQIKKARVETY